MSRKRTHLQRPGSQVVSPEQLAGEADFHGRALAGGLLLFLLLQLKLVEVHLHRDG